MNSDLHALAKKLFLEVCDLSDDDLPAALDRACADDMELRREVESLLSFRGNTEVITAWDPASRDALPERIGSYRVVRKLGEGGMGVVYEVRQDHPVRRRLALKLVKWGMDTKDVLTRFESERQVLAMMDHPNVAKVFDAGVTERGRPFFTMEYVEGDPLTTYCDDYRLNTQERLDLFVQVCEGVQHAHHHGIIHRDIKSSNILVRMRDGKPVPMIIDFGVAKATQQRLTEKTLYTERGMLIGTPEYMSPEQAMLTGLDVDTRTDVYSLGVVLYELLVGALPFDSETLRRGGFDEIRRKIREEEPSRPSTRVTAPSETSVEVARRRRTDPVNLRRELTGDMDWITMKALEKDRTRRYNSPAEMIADIKRHLCHQPVLASPPGTVYRVRKFVRRHRIGVAAAATVALALVLGLGLATAGLVRARRAERLASQEAQKANQVSEMLAGLFDDLNQAIPGHVVTPEQLLERGLIRIESELAEEPVLKARLLGYLAGAFASAGNTERGTALAEETLALCRKHLPSDHPYLAEALGLLGDILSSTEKLHRAKHLHLEALEIRQRNLGPDGVSLGLGRTYQSLGTISFRMGELSVARSYLDRSEEILDREMLSPYRSHLAATLVSRAILAADGDLDPTAALPRLERALAINEAEFGPEHDRTQAARAWLGQMHYRLGDPERARAYYEHGRDSVMSMIGLGELLAAAGDFTSARDLLERAFSRLDEHSPTKEWCARCLADVRRRTGDIDGARLLLEESLEALERGAGREHPVLSRTLHELGYLEMRAGNLDRARDRYRRALEIQTAVWEPEHYVHTSAFYRLAGIAAREGDREQALDLLRRALRCGYDGEEILADADLASLRGTPEFEEILAEVRRRLASKS